MSWGACWGVCGWTGGNASADACPPPRQRFGDAKMRMRVSSAFGFHAPLRPVGFKSADRWILWIKVPKVVLSNGCRVGCTPISPVLMRSHKAFMSSRYVTGSFKLRTRFALSLETVTSPDTWNAMKPVFGCKNAFEINRLLQKRWRLQYLENSRKF